MIGEQLKLRVLQGVAGTRAFHPVYHAVGDHPMPHLRHLVHVRPQAEFERDIEYFLRHFKPMQLDEVAATLAAGRQLPAGALLLTVDDGLREAYELMAPVLERKGCPASFFLCANFIDNRELGWRHKTSLLREAIPDAPEAARAAAVRVLAGNELMPASGDLDAAVDKVPYAQRRLLDEVADCLGVSFAQFLSEYRPYMTSAEVEDLQRRGFQIGAHSMDHPRYRDLSETAQLQQTVDSMNWIQTQFGTRQRVFAHPFSNSGLPVRHFRQLFDTANLDLVLGTAEGKQDVDRRALNRNAMESAALRPAARIVETYLVRYAARRLTGRNHMKRA